MFEKSFVQIYMRGNVNAVQTPAHLYLCYGDITGENEGCIYHIKEDL